MTWGEYKQYQLEYIEQVEEAGVKETDWVGDGVAELCTDGCNCDFDDPKLGDIRCADPNNHFCQLLYVNGHEIELPY